MTGEGIAQAIETGMLAARAIAASPDDTEAVVDRYRADVDRALGRGPALRGVAAAHPAAPDRRTRRHRHRRRSPRGRGATSPAGCSRTIPRALVFTPGRWRRGLLTRPGAYPDALL